MQWGRVVIPSPVPRPPGADFRGTVTKDMQDWAVDVLHRARADGWDAKPTLRFEDRAFGPLTLRAWVCWHPPDPKISGQYGWHSGVTLLDATGLGIPPTPPVTTVYAEGIDVSKYQGAIVWDQVAADGKSFAIVKATEGTGIVDPRVDENIKGADEAGLLVGAYHFFRPQLDAAEQAQRLLDAAGNVTLRYALDVETFDGVSAAELRDAIVVFFQQIPARGLVYTAPSFVAAGAIPSQADLAFGFDLWIAHWGVAAPSVPGWTFWQYSQTGTVKGITGHVDLNRFAGGADSLSAWAVGQV